MDLFFNSSAAAFLSNFAASDVAYDDVYYPSVEAAYQAAKTDNPELRKQFECASARTAKRLGKTLPLRAGWDSMKLSVMEDLIEQKFNSTPYYELLKGTGDTRLVHYCPWGDRFWGVDRKHIGLNHLGIIIMNRRALL